MSKELMIPGQGAGNSLVAYSQDLDTKLRFCQVLIQSGMMPKHVRGPQAALTSILYGQELGFSPLVSLNLIQVIEGVPSVNAAGLKAKAIAAGGEIRTVKWSRETCILKGRRKEWEKGEWEEVEYSLEDAKTAQLAHKQNWIRNPKAMLYARCVSVLVRNVWPDILAGLYSTEEMLDSTGRAFEVSDTGAVAVIEATVEPRPEAQPAAKEERKIVERSEWIYETGGLDPETQIQTEEQLESLSDKGVHYDAEIGAWVSPKPLRPRDAKTRKLMDSILTTREEIEARRKAKAESDADDLPADFGAGLSDGANV